MHVHTVNLEIFARILFSGIALKNACNVKHLRLGHDLLILVNDRVISPIREDFFHEISHAKFRENKTLPKFSNLQYLRMNFITETYMYSYIMY